MRNRAVLVVIFLSGLCAAGTPVWSGADAFPEQFDYRWSLAGFKGALVSLFIPGQGEGRLTTDFAGKDRSGENLVTELRISSHAGKDDEFWLYGAEIDAIRKRTVRAWSAQRFRGKSKRKEREAGDIDALDLASSIYYLRQELPDRPFEEMIWSSGRLNPVVIRPGPRGSATWNGREVATRSYAIRGVSKPGQPNWKGKMDLVLTDNEQAVPVEIRVVRKGVRVRLKLVESGEL